MNMFKKNGGFTLVELIVVIAILAILAGVAVPAYTGYINRAEDAATLSELGAVLTAAQAAATLNNTEIKQVSVEGDGTAASGITITCADSTADVSTDFASLYTGTVKLQGTFKDGAVWSTTTPEWKAG